LLLKVVATLILNKLILVAHPGTDIVKWMRWRTISEIKIIQNKIKLGAAL